MKTQSILTSARIESSLRARINPIRNLRPESLSRMLDAFNAGELRATALAWESIEQRDDVLKAVATKRKKAPARFGWEIEPLDTSDTAKAHAEALRFFYENLTAMHASDGNETGGLSLLLRQMMDATGKRYAVHEIVWQPQPGQPARLSATLRFVPLWFFENRTGRLRLINSHGSANTELEPGSWMVTTGDGLMEACSIAYLFKHLPLRDWLVYCERNGMPGVRGVTDALPGTPEWEAARDAVRDFGAEFHALMNRGTDIEAIDLGASSALPYPQLVERMDRAMATLWRGSSMGSVTSEGAGISLQLRETALVEREDVEHLSSTLHTQLDRHIVRHCCGEEHPRARIRIRHREAGLQAEQIADVRSLVTQALPEAIANLITRLAQPAPDPTANLQATE